MKRITLLTIVIALTSSPLHAVEPASVDKATAVAKAVDLMIRATRSMYTGKVVKKTEERW